MDSSVKSPSFDNATRPCPSDAPMEKSFFSPESLALTKIRPTILASAVKLCILPALFLPVAIWSGFRGSELVAVLVMTGSPTTISCYIMAKNMGNDAELTASIVVATTLISSLTLTLWIFLLRSLGMI